MKHNYAEAVKKHIHQKLNPNKSDPPGSKNRPQECDRRRYSETLHLPHKGLNFCPTPPPPGKYDIDKDIDVFACRLTLKEHHTPENIEEITDGPGYQPSILKKLNQKERKTYTRPSREPYLNMYILTD